MPLPSFQNSLFQAIRERWSGHYSSCIRAFNFNGDCVENIARKDGTPVGLGWGIGKFGILQSADFDSARELFAPSKNIFSIQSRIFMDWQGCDESLLRFFPLDGDVTDWASGEDGVNNGVSWSWEQKYGTRQYLYPDQSALYRFGYERVGVFDGLTDYINCGSAADIDNLPNGGSTGFTVAGWIKITSKAAATTCIVDGKDRGSGGWRIENYQWSDNNTRMYACVRCATSLASAFSGLGGYDIPLNTWTHICMTYDDTTKLIKCYVNGKDKTTGAVAGVGARLDDSAYNMNVGARQIGVATFDRYFPGYISDVGVWNRILSAAQIAHLALRKDATITGLRAFSNLGGTGTRAAWGEAPTIPNGHFFTPSYIAFDSEGNYWLSEHNAHFIEKFSGDGAFLLRVGTAYGAGDTEFTDPYGVAVDANDNVYVVDSSNTTPCIKVFDKDGNFLRRWGTLGTADGEFSYNIYKVRVVGNYVYVVDSGNKRIQKFDLLGNFVLKWGVPVPGPTFVGVGLNDMTTPCYYWSGDTERSFVVEIDSTGATDTFKWSKNGGVSWDQTLRPIPGAGVHYSLTEEVRIAFAAITGHTLGDKWTFTRTHMQMFDLRDVDEDSDGNIWIIDRGCVGNKTKYKQFTPDGTFIKRWYGATAHGNTFVIDPATDIAYITDGEMRVGDHIQKYDLVAGSLLDSWEPHGAGPGCSLSGNAIGMDNDGHLWTPDWMAHKINVWTNTGVLRGFITSNPLHNSGYCVRLIENSGLAIPFYRRQTLTAVTYQVSFLAFTDGSAVTEADLKAFASTTVVNTIASTTFTHLGDGVYLGKATFPGTVAVWNVGVEVQANKTVYIVFAKPVKIDLGWNEDLNDLAEFAIIASIYPRTDGEGDHGQIYSKGTGLHFEVRSEAGGQVALYGMVDCVTTDAETTTHATDKIPTNTWSNILITWTADKKIRFYRISSTGLPIEFTYATQTAGVGDQISDGGYPATIGNYHDYGGAFDGLIDTFRLYKAI